MKWLRSIFIASATLALGAATVPVIEVPAEYYVRTAPEDEAQFSKVPRTHDVSKLKEAHIVGTACYNEFRDETKKHKTIRERTDCGDHFKRRDLPNQPVPVREGYTWIGYSTYLFDTPTGDLEEGYFVESEAKERETILGSILETTIPRAEAAVAHDTTTSGLVASVDTVSFAHVGPASGTLVVGVGVQDTIAIDRKVSTCTYNSKTLFQAANIDAHSNFTISVFEDNAPASGSNTVFCQTSDEGAASVASDTGVAAVSLTGADLQFPIVATTSATGASASSAVTITTVYDGSLVVDFSITDETNASNIVVGGDLHVERAEVEITGENFNAGTAGPVTPAGATTTSWSWTGTENWAIVAVEVRPPCTGNGVRCTDIITTTGTTTWTAPTNVSSVDVACWGAGGGGGTIANNGGAGGGGGAYASTTGISVTPGVGYEVFIGTGGAAETAGGVSQFYNGTTHSPIACGGGAGIDASTVGVGGTTACSVGSAAESAGGDGAVGDTTTASDTGGGGGGAGGPNGAGGAGTSGAAGASGTGGTGNNGLGGAGGSGGISSGNNGAPGTGHRTGGGGSGGAGNLTAGDKGAYGGGGGGSESAGGSGGDGMCQISYTPTAGGGGGGIGDILDSIIWFLED